MVSPKGFDPKTSWLIQAVPGSARGLVEATPEAMIDDSRLLKSKIGNRAGGVRNKQVTDEQGPSRAIDAKVKSPPIFKSPGRAPGIAFTAGKHHATHAVRVGPIAANFPAWALQQPSEPRPQEAIASPAAGQRRLSSPPLRPLVTVGEAATILHVSARTLRRLIGQGEIPVVRIGRSVRIRPKDIERIIFGNQNDWIH
jgi:excisionase family DNA binding protein